MTMATQPATKYSRIALEVNAPIARLTRSNPPLNIIYISMMEELFEALTEINARSDISVLIVSGSQKAFSVGVDIAAHTPDKVEQMLTKFHSVIRTLIGLRK